MDQHIVLTPEKARGASKEGVVRYVLGISLLLVVILCGWLLFQSW